jgi:predicted dehydrogenase
MKPIQTALIGAGGRGTGTFGDFAIRNPNEIQFIAVAEPDSERRARFAALHNIPKEHQFSTWEELLARPQLCEALIIATMDQLHYAPTMSALDIGYDILLEKPMSNDPAECLRMAHKAQDQQRLLMICHVLRYTQFFSSIKQIIDSGVLGEIVSVQHNENVGYYHQAHSFTRGNWRNSQLSSPMILAKCCHDMDILVWLIGKRCLKIASFGSLNLFKPEKAPTGAPARCTDGCPVERQCPYSAIRIYIEEHPDPGDFIRPGMTATGEAKWEALRTGPYGRCVYRCDNDVVDHQVISMEFDGGITVAFTMCGFTADISRSMKIMGTMGELRAHMESNEIEVHDFITHNRQVIHPATGLGHGGGDDGLLHTFASKVRSLVPADRLNALTSASISVQSHMMAFAAEAARLEKRVVDLEEFALQFSK